MNTTTSCAPAWARGSSELIKLEGYACSGTAFLCNGEILAPCMPLSGRFVPGQTGQIVRVWDDGTVGKIDLDGIRCQGMAQLIPSALMVSGPSLTVVGKMKEVPPEREKHALVWYDDNAPDLLEGLFRDDWTSAKVIRADGTIGGQSGKSAVIWRHGESKPTVLRNPESVRRLRYTVSALPESGTIIVGRGLERGFRYERDVAVVWDKNLKIKFHVDRASMRCSSPNGHWIGGSFKGSAAIWCSGNLSSPPSQFTVSGSQDLVLGPVHQVTDDGYFVGVSEFKPFVGKVGVQGVVFLDPKFDEPFDGILGAHGLWSWPEHGILIAVVGTRRISGRIIRVPLSMIG